MLGDSHRERPEEMVHAFLVDQLIPQNHILRSLDKALDTWWVRGEVASCYSANKGRRSWDPEVIVRMMLLGYLYGYSEKRMCEEVQMHLGFRWFCRIQPSDPVPDRTTLVKLRNHRWQQELWVTILETSIEACVKAGLVSGRHVAIDGTVIQANAAMGSIEPIEPPLSLRDHLRARCGWVKLVPPAEKPAPDKPKDDDLRPGGSADFRGQTRSNTTHCSTTDPDAMLYRKGQCTGAQLAYLGHVCLDTKSRVVLATTVTQAHTSAEWEAGATLLDEANARVDDRIKVVSADAGYGVERFLAEVEARVSRRTFRCVASRMSGRSPHPSRRSFGTRPHTSQEWTGWAYADATGRSGRAEHEAIGSAGSCGCGSSICSARRRRVTGSAGRGIEDWRRCDDR